ncbi:hypothetical protein [Paenibacillus cymbidii]|uniref:hypothetical protein n=1 Tax=Paenibacillus cymbidii TaxID=1639034 RepID=UPI001081062A|nr:hypothetical protein [Paenibacillus cymbidii]
MVAFTWLVFILNPLIGSIFSSIGLFSDRKRNIHYSAMMALLCSSFAYWFIPKHEMDLTRYFAQLKSYSTLSWDSFYEIILSKQLLVIQELLFYFIAQSQNYHLLPAISIFISYFILFYIITDYSNKNNVRSREMFGTLIFILCVLPFPILVSNVRNIMAFSIFIFGAYREFEQGKRNVLTYILYMIPVFIHIATVSLLLLRIIVSIYDFNKKRSIVISLGIASVAFFITQFSEIVEKSGLPNRVIQAFFIKADNYATNNDSAYAIYLQSNLFMNLQKYYFVSIVLFFLMLLFIIRRQSSILALNEKHKKMLSFYSLVCLTVVGTAPIVITVYLRFTFPAIMLSFLVLLRYHQWIKSKISKQIISFGILSGAIGGLIQQIIFLDKVTNISQMFSSVTVRSLINMYIPIT